MPSNPAIPGSLRSRLNHEPRELQFGTSGRRGEVAHLTQLEIYINALAELEFLQSLPKAEGGIARGEEFYFAYDLRPTSCAYAYAAEWQGRGELAQTIERALVQAGMKPVNLGKIPTPALTSYALRLGKGSMMVTGSHIPFDRNGYKTNTSCGELLKRHEPPIAEKVREVRTRLYEQDFQESPFDADGRFKSGHAELPAERDDAARHYLRRYLDFFGAEALSGLRVLVYQHSAVGRDLLVDILRALGAEVIAAGRSETFVPIDTENMDAERLATIQSLLDECLAAQGGRFDAIVSTDGDSDRPMILGVDAADQARFFGGDLVGMLTAEFLGADAVVVPISCNDAIDRGALKDILAPKTRIGSPFVIAGMEQALARGKRAVCGFEANGGFLTGSDIARDGRTLAALPTRDAVLPILAVLSLAKSQNLPLTELFARLPKRYSRPALLKDFPRALGLDLVRRFSPADPAFVEAAFPPQGEAVLLDAQGVRLATSATAGEGVEAIRQDLAEFFSSEAGFAPIARLNYIDGVRIYFANGEVAHLRPSGNADELRIYAVADEQTRADEIAAKAIAEPDGIFRRMAGSLGQARP
jgi:phosphomannomutase